MAAAGVDPGRIDVTGFPVDPFFHRHEGEWRPPEFGSGVQPRVLYIVNSGRSRAPETAERLLRETDWEITCTVGRDDELRRRLLAVAAGRRARTEVLGWTNEIPRLLMTHHVVVSKAGGATTQEALAARCPMVVNQIVPGQEEGNYELLRRHGVGALATTPEQVLAALRAAFADGAALWSVWRRAVAPLSRPRAAREILDLVLAKAGTGPGAGTAEKGEFFR
jgi:processive 1,2-diacylglycerol beta-glucosyltransferase